MPAIFPRPQLKGDIASLVEKYASIEYDVQLLENLLRESFVPSLRCSEFVPRWIWRVEVSIAALPGPESQGRCSLVYEKDSTACYLLMLYDNDEFEFEDVIAEVRERLGPDDD